VVRYQTGQEFAAHLDTGPTLSKWAARTLLLHHACVVPPQRAAMGSPLWGHGCSGYTCRRTQPHTRERGRCAAVLPEGRPAAIKNFQLYTHVPGSQRSPSEALPRARGRRCRIATCLIYLNGRDEFGGGETHFPDLGAHGLTVSPELGKAALWLNARPADGASLEPHARHAGLKVTRGEKWVCTQWVHAGRFGGT